MTILDKEAKALYEHQQHIIMEKTLNQCFSYDIDILKKCSDLFDNIKNVRCYLTLVKGTNNKKNRAFIIERRQSLHFYRTMFCVNMISH
jgi:hypothetical protein